MRLEVLPHSTKWVHPELNEPQHSKEQNIPIICTSTENNGTGYTDNRVEFHLINFHRMIWNELVTPSLVLDRQKMLPSREQFCLSREMRNEDGDDWFSQKWSLENRAAGQSIWCCHCLCCPFADKPKTPSCKLKKPGPKYLLTSKQASSRTALLVPSRAATSHNPYSNTAFSEVNKNNHLNPAMREYTCTSWFAS